MQKGKIIILNGVSSSGKSTLAKALQLKLTENYFCLALDTFTDIISPLYYENKYTVELDRQSMLPLYHTIKLFADMGLNIVVDTVMCDWKWDDGVEWKPFEECLMLLHDYPVLFVKVDCPIHELNRRERERGDREIGIAEWCYSILTPQYDYDIVVNTHENSTNECADKIIEVLNYPENFKAFKNLWVQRNK